MEKVLCYNCKSCRPSHTQHTHVSQHNQTQDPKSSTSVIMLDSVMQIVRQLEQGSLMNKYINKQTLEQH